MKPFVLSFLLLVTATRPSTTQDAVVIPVTTHRSAATSLIRLEGFVYKPGGVGKFPVVIFSHGSAGGDPRLTEPAAEIAEYYVSHGFAVVVAMRRGRGKSEGSSLESEERNCDPTSWEPGIETAFEDLTGVIDYAWRLPFVDSSQTILAGASRGGFLSVAYAARGSRRTRVVGVINFVGAWVAQAEDHCPVDFNYLSFEQFGHQTATPMLWLYGDHDLLNSTTSIRSYVKVFQTSGGHVRFVLIPNVPDNGHWLPRYLDLWRRPSDEYLAALGLRGR